MRQGSSTTHSSTLASTAFVPTLRGGGRRVSHSTQVPTLRRWPLYAGAHFTQVPTLRMEADVGTMGVGGGGSHVDELGQQRRQLERLSSEQQHRLALAVLGAQLAVLEDLHPQATKAPASSAGERECTEWTDGRTDERTDG